MIYESVCKECNQVVGKSKDIPRKDYYKLVILAQQLKECPNCGAKSSATDFKFTVREARH